MTTKKLKEGKLKQASLAKTRTRREGFARDRELAERCCQKDCTVSCMG